MPIQLRDRCHDKRQRAPQERILFQKGLGEKRINSLYRPSAASGLSRNGLRP
ncbi:MAG: hypothetical protein NZ602_13085 [Thermoguttaceae bacterium]|nr:hypothetical protein [Thermoguttaceae bacterium]MDW8037985.1 hypothetical protein [Thermoguttaceae bacterium]